MTTSRRPETNDDDHVLAAWRLFDDAVAALTGPRHDLVIADDGSRVVVTAPSVYDDMKAELAGRQGTAFGGSSRSMPPLWVDGVDWFRVVDATVAQWAPGATGSTPERLTYLLEWTWQPKDYLWLRGAATELQGWAQDAKELIEGRGRFEITAPCPACQTAQVTRVDESGEHVRSAALQVSMAGACCLACGHRWDLAGVMDFAAALGCTPLEGVDTGVAYTVR